MIPDIAPAMRSPGEAELFERFRAEPGTEDWIVLHSLDLPVHVERVAGEADFVVIVPGKGVLVLEIKAVQSLRREQGVWFLGNAEKGDARGPFKQASDAMHSLREVVSHRQPAVRQVLFWSAVVFPYLQFSERSPEWHEWQAIDATQLRRSGLRAALVNVLDHARDHVSKTKSAAWFRAGDARPTLQESNVIAAILRKDFEFYESPRSRIRRLNDEVLRYTEEQYAALDAMADNPRVLFDGAAGTGKTMLAIEAVRRAARAKSRVLILCFNRALGHWLSRQLDASPDVVSGTAHSHLLKLTGLTGRESTDFWENELPSAAVDLALNDRAGQFDVLILDEAQDLLKHPLLEYFDIVLTGGLRSGRWLMFGDLTNQRIFRRDALDPEPLLAHYSALAPRFRLTENCRNTPRIATYAGVLGGVPESYRKVRRPDNGLTPQTKFYLDQHGQQVELLRTLEALAAEGLAGEAVAVLSARADGACADCLSESRWADRRCDLDDLREGRIRCGTIHAFKGLEAPAVILTDIETFDYNDRDLFYTGATRALERVVVLAHERTRAPLAHALLEVGNHLHDG